jgi:predicted GNAT family acetyltransferase
METEHGLAVAVYVQQGDRLVFTHTEVPAADEGKGIGSRLVRAALDDARQRGFKIKPACSFVAAFIRRHPEYAD